MKTTRLSTVLTAVAVVFLSFQSLDAQEDKKPRQGESQQEMRRGGGKGRMQGQRGQGRRGRGDRSRRESGGLKIGQEAPTFVLKSLDGKSETDLATFKNKKPVVLFFGSYT
jgi:hypothetical protein